MGVVVKSGGKILRGTNFSVVTKSGETKKVKSFDSRKKSSSTSKVVQEYNEPVKEPSTTPTSSSIQRQTPVIAVQDTKAKQSRLLTSFEAEAYVTTSGGQSVPDNKKSVVQGTTSNNSIPKTDRYMIIKGEYQQPKGGSTKYTRYQKPRTIKKKTTTIKKEEKKVVSSLPTPTYKEEKIIKGLTYYGQKLEQSQYKTGMSKPLSRAGAFVIGFGTGFISAINPVNIYRGAKALITNPGNVLSTVREKARTSPYSFYGETVGAASMPTILGKGFGTVKNIYIKSGSRYVPQEKVFSSKVLSGEQVMPLTRSTRESIARFKSTSNQQGNIYVSTASPSKISSDVAGIGKKASAGLEDPGIYVTPSGEASPYFLRVGKEVPTQYSLNPFKDIKSRVGVPTVTEFKASGVTTYPRYVLESPGFKATTQYQEGIIGTGKVIITKRSMIGQGEVKSFGYPGTSEIEAVVPVGQKFSYAPKSFIGKVKGFDEYTIYEGKPIALRRANLLKDGKAIGDGKTIISTGKIARETKSVSSTISSNVKTSSVVPVGSSIVSSFSSSPKPTSIIRGASISNTSRSYSKNISSKSVSALSDSTSVTSSPIKSSSTSSVSGFSSHSPSSSIISSSTSSSSGLTSSTYYSSSYSNFASITTRTTIKTPVKLLEDKKSLYDVYVKRRGVYKRYNPRPISLRGAESLGRRYTSLTPSASFKIISKKTRSPVNPKSIVTSKKYRSGKADPFSFVERRKYRINSPGELKGITFEGIKKQRKGLI